MTENKIDKRNVEDIMGLTSLQEGMLFHYLSDPGSKQYFEQFRLQLSGEMKVECFEQAWQTVGQTNEILRAVIRWEQLEEPLQVILKQKKLPIRIIDLRQQDDRQIPGQIDKILQQDQNQTIDIAREPIRITLCRIDENKSEMILTFHHILYDGWSQGIILSEFLEAYQRLLEGEPPDQRQKTRLKEFFKWYQSLDRHRQEDSWKKLLEGFDTRTLLPYDKNKLGEIARVNIHSFTIPPAIKDQVDQCSQGQNITLSTILYAAWGILLQKYNNSNDIIFGTTISGRTPEIKGIETMVGLFINTLPLRLQTFENNTAAEVFQSLSRQLEERNQYGREHSSLTRIKQMTGIGRDSNLFDSLVVIDNYPLDNLLNRPGDLALRITSYDMFEMTNFDLTLQILLLEAGQMRIDFRFNTDLFEEKTIQRMACHYLNTLERITQDPLTKISMVQVLSPGEIKRILEEFNCPGIAFRVDKTIHGEIEARAARNPQDRAVGFEDQWITYRELDERANQLARLLGEYGVVEGSRAALLFPRSIDMITALLAILKAGAACIPLDISHPWERSGFIIRDSEAGFILTAGEPGIDLQQADGTGSVVHIAYDPEKLKAFPPGNPEKSVQPEDLSYIIYTSGSTGKPKGALLHHSGIVNHTYTKIEVLGITEKDVAANNFSINVIAAVWQILAPLFTGAQLVVYSDEIEWDPYRQFEQVEADGVTVIEVIPSVLKAYLFVLDEGKNQVKLENLRKIALTTEETKPFLVNKFYERYRHIDLVDCYGQTECCDDVLHYTIPHDTNTQKVPIGTPSLNTNVFVLDHHQQLQPVGIPGEICVIGAGVAYGYWKRPELTAEKFDQDLKDLKNYRDYNDGYHRSYKSYTSYNLYRTGDLGRWLPDGKIEYLGRVDHQVKIRGNRVELREIENQMMGYSIIKEAAVVAKEDKEGDKNLYAFFIADEEVTVGDLRQYLSKYLPDYMIPARFIRMEQLPLTPNGKIDRKALVKAEIKGDIATGTEYKPPRSEFEKKIQDIWSRLLEKDKEQIGINDNFFDLGGHSLLLIKLKSKLEKTFEPGLNQELPIIELFNHPTIAHQARYIEENLKVKAEVKVKEKEKTPKDFDKSAQDTKKASPTKSFCGGPGGGFLEKSPLAVIGISLHIPGAANIHEFWENLSNGIESIAFFEEEELEGSKVDNYVKGNCQLVPAGGIIGDIEQFDADFFGFNPREAEIIDPQQRLFLEHAWNALEDAGYGAVGDTFTGAVGVYAGVGLNTYLLNNVMAQPQVVNTLGEFQTMIGNDKDFLATRAAYKLNLRGPAITLQTACSTSLVAIHLARKGLLNGDCDMALVGGVAVHVPERTGYFYNEGGYLSPNGHCRAFDAEANGTVFGNGIGVVVLKPLAAAIDDNDHIYALVKSSAINNDGSLKVGYTSPGEMGQASVVFQALADANVTPDTIGYIETHGTGTVLGDPVELAALGRAFREAAVNKPLKNQYCAIGSVKSNIGHLDIAAGIIGFIKAVLCLNHRQLPPSINVKTPNPMADFANTPFYVNRELTDWSQPGDGMPRRAGVSSFGIGGTNAHVILEECSEGTGGLAPLHGKCSEGTGGLAPLFNEESSRKHQLILLSAKSETALKKTTANLVNHLKQHPDILLDNTAYTLTMGRKAFDHRLALVCRDRQDAIAALESFNPKRLVMHTRTPGDKSMVFMFPGVGEHYVNMAYDLYRQEPVFKEHLDRCCDILQPLLEKDLREVLFVEKPGKDTNPGENKADIDLRKLLDREQQALSEEEKLLSRTIYSQTAVFVVEYGLAQLLMAWGIKPYAMIGYSIGEYVAACLSGVFSLEDALYLVAGRARLIHGLETGAMTAISLPEHEIKQQLPGISTQIAVAAVNAPDLCIVSGKPADIKTLEQQLQKRKLVFRRLKTFQAFHSPMMEAVREELTALFNKVTRQAPTIPFISNVTGTWVKAEEVTRPGYWVTHTVSPIRFSDGIGELLKTSCNFFLEIGPGNSLCGFAAQHHEVKKSSGADRFVLASLPKESENISSEAFLLRALSKLWAAGLEIRWDSFYKYEAPARKRVSLPAYPFERKRYWLEAAAGDEGDRADGVHANPAAAFNQGPRIAKEENIADWFYLPYWKQSLPPLPGVTHRDHESEENWLLFSDDSPMAHRLTRELKTPRQITVVKIGQRFAKHQEEGQEVYTIDPGHDKDYITLLQDLAAQSRGIDKIIHLWQWSSPGESPAFLDYGVYSLLYLVKAMGKLSWFDTIEIWMVSRGLHRIESSDSGHPCRAAILGPCKVISQEYPNIICRSIDFQDEAALYYDEQRMMQQLVSELKGSSPDRVIAFRGNNRWVQSYEHVKLEKGPDVPVILRDRGVYLVSGGLGNIGFSIAQYLAASVRARLVLTTHSAWPVKEQNHPRLMKVKQLEDLGAQVLVVQADAADKQQMQQAVKQAEETFGPLDGVLYASGIMDDRIFKLIADAGRQDCELHFKTKIYGLMVLEEVLRDKEPDFCLLASSLSPILGGLSLFAYSAGNSFMDAFAHRQALAAGKNWLSLNWADWQRGEPSNETCANLVMGSTVVQLDITPGEGQETFKRVLSLFGNGNRLPQLVVSSGDLHRRLQQWVLADPGNGTDASSSDSSKTGRQIVHRRPQLQSIYEAPKNEAETIVAEIWQELLGFESIGVHDNFFELGGHSLIATKLISRLREIFRIDIPLPTLFDRPTIREVVDNIAYTWGGHDTVEEIAKTYRQVQAMP